MRTSAKGAYLPTFLNPPGGGASGVGLTGKPKETPIQGLGVGRPRGEDEHREDEPKGCGGLIAGLIIPPSGGTDYYQT